MITPSSKAASATTKKLESPSNIVSTQSSSIQIPQSQVIGLQSSKVPATSRAGFFIKYELREEIGVGSTSKCFKCVRKQDGKEFACKVIEKRQVEAKFSGLLDQFYVEIKVLSSLSHPNIIHLEDTYETSDRIYMVMELMLGGEVK